MLISGEWVGSCRIIELIGTGGVANVYKAWQGDLEEVRAIKVLKPGFTLDQKARLEAEGEVSSAIHHPGIVQTYKTGYYNSLPYLEMEYVDGPSLKDILKKTSVVPIHFALSAALLICDSLHFLHDSEIIYKGKRCSGLVHRDIKPANILFSSGGAVKLADLGISLPAGSTALSADSRIRGTIAYLSPEQLNGEVLDRRSDIYSLGAVIFEMVCGRKVFPDEELPVLIEKICRGQYLFPGECAARIPEELGDIIENCLRVDPGHRFTDTLKLREALEKILTEICGHEPLRILVRFMQENAGLFRRC